MIGRFDIPRRTVQKSASISPFPVIQPGSFAVIEQVEDFLAWVTQLGRLSLYSQPKQSVRSQLAAEPILTLF